MDNEYFVFDFPLKGGIILSFERGRKWWSFFLEGDCVGLYQIRAESGDGGEGILYEDPDPVELDADAREAAREYGVSDFEWRLATHHAQLALDNWMKGSV